MPEFNVLVNVTIVNEFEAVEADSEQDARLLVEEVLWGAGKALNIVTPLNGPEIDTSYDGESWEVEDTEIQEVTELD